MSESKPPLLSVIIPTCGRTTLERTLQSIHQQVDKTHQFFHSDRVEVLVIGDTHGGKFLLPLSVVPSLCQKYNVKYLEYDGGEHMYGHPQRNYGQKIASGRWLAFFQDDDCYVQGAFDAMFDAIEGHWGVILGQTKTWQVGVVWREKELYEGNIDADCIVVPNVPERLGVWANRYSGDFDFIRDTCELWDNRIFWCPKLFAVGRP
jgi:hypothetical protein